MTNRAKTLFALAVSTLVPGCVMPMTDKTIINRLHGGQRDTSRRVVGAVPVQRLKA